MIHLPYFGVKNFKIFQEETMFEFKPITFLIGKNSSGKSSLTRAMFYFHALYDGKNAQFSKYELSDFEDFISHHSQDDTIEFVLPFAWPGINALMTYHVTFKKEGRYILIEESQIRLKKDNTLIFESKDIGPNHFGDPGIKVKVYWETLYNEYLVTKSNVSETLKCYLDIIKKLGKTKEELIFPRINFLTKLNIYPEFSQDYNRFLALNEQSSLFPELCTRSISNLPVFSIMADQSPTNAMLDDYKENGFTFSRNNITNRRESQRHKYPEFLKQYQELTLEEFVIENELQTLLNYSKFNSENKDYYKNDIETLRIKERQLLNIIFDRFLTMAYSHEFPFNILSKKDMSEENEHLLLTNTTIKFEDYKNKISNFIREINSEISLNLNEEDIVLEGSDLQIFSIYINCLDTGDLNENMKNIYSQFEYLKSNRLSQDRFIESKDYNKSAFHNFFITRNPDEILKKNKHIIHWIREFEIADDINVTSHENLGIKAIGFVKNGKSINMSDVGFGHVQILPILLRCCFAPPKLMIIEEPEANLHPALQSKLAEFFVYCQKEFGTQFIIETHSEYLIRKMQTLVSKEIIKPDDATIYYFYTDENEKSNQVKNINFEENGILTDSFGHGFFDESDRLSMELLSLNYGQSN